MLINLIIGSILVVGVYSQNAADLEYSPYVFKAVDIPFKSVS